MRTIIHEHFYHTGAQEEIEHIRWVCLKHYSAKRSGAQEEVEHVR
jgi:hypothetical protein